ncbi:uncharacterized protein LOC127725650 [Mytilus californianus]|uniref:uncharacterized protein LOC127725650 n=1 Tax=Mytilus californianus TaxID=6549 RepID=UPI002247BD2A|nr:uncharacterized protein LOC127725650 [Mytilus californianus]
MEVLQLIKMCLTPLFVIAFVNFFVLQVEGGVCQGDPSKIVSMCQESSVISSAINIDTSFFSKTMLGQRCTCEIIVNSTALSINTLSAPSTLECGTVVTFKLVQNPKIECTTSKNYIDTSIEKQGVVEISTTSSTVTDTGYCIEVSTGNADEMITMTCYENEVTATTEIPPISVMKELLQQNNQTSEAVLEEMSRNPNASVLFEPLMSSSELMSFLNNTEQLASTKEKITSMPHNNNTESTSNTTETIPVEVVNAVIKQYNGSNSNESDISTVLFEPFNSTDIPSMMINTTYKDTIQNVTSNEYTDMNNSSLIFNGKRTTSTEKYSESLSGNAPLISAQYKTTTENVPTTSDLSPMNLFSSYMEKEKVTDNQLNNAVNDQVTVQNSSPVPDIQSSKGAWSFILPDDTNKTDDIMSKNKDILSSAIEQDILSSETYKQSTISPSNSDTILSSDFDFEYLKPTMSWEISNLKSLSSALAPLADITSNDMAFMSIVPSMLAIVPTKTSEVTSLTQVTSVVNSTSSTLSMDEYQSKAADFTDMLPPQGNDAFLSNTETSTSTLPMATSEQHVDVNVEESTSVVMSTDPETTKHQFETTETTISSTESETTTQHVETTKTIVLSTTNAFIQAETTTEHAKTPTEEPPLNAIPVIPGLGTTKEYEHIPFIPETGTTKEHGLIPVIPEIGTTKEHEHVPVIPETEFTKDHGHIPDRPETGTTREHEHIPVIPETGTTREHKHIPVIPETGTTRELDHIPVIPETGTTKEREHIPVLPETGTTREREHIPSLPETGSTKEHGHTTQTKHPMKIMPIIPDQNIKQNIRLLPPVNQNELDKIFSGISDNFFTTKVPNTGENLEPQGSTEEEDVLSEETVTIIVIGSVIGILALVAVIVILTTILQKRKRSSNMAASKDLELNGKGIDNPLMELERQNEVNSSFGQNGNGTIHEEPELETAEVEGGRNGEASSVPDSKPEDTKTQETNDA